MTVAVIGMGFVGFTVAAHAALDDKEVIGIDIDKKRLKYLEDVFEGEKDLGHEEKLLDLFLNHDKSIELKSDYGNYLNDANIKIVCVSDKHIEKAIDDLCPYINKNDLIIIESTINPSRIRYIIGTIWNKTGFNIFDDIHLAFCPERIMEGKAYFNFIHETRMIGARREESAKKAMAFYQTLGVRGFKFGAPEEVVLAKLFENATRFVNITIANELSKVCNKFNVDYDKVKYLANARLVPVLLKDGLGVGGDCLPFASKVVEKILNENSIFSMANDREQYLRFEKVGEILDALDEFLVENGENKILILGISYRPNGSSIKNSPARQIAELLDKKTKYFVSYYDPKISEFYSNLREEHRPVKNDYDLVLVLVAHDEFKNLSDLDIPVILDTVGIVEKISDKSKLYEMRW